jgi:hypothetical protein
MKKCLPALLQFFNYVFQQRCTQSEIDVFEDGGWVKQYAPSLFKTIDIGTIIEQCKKNKTQTFITHPLVFSKAPLIGRTLPLEKVKITFFFFFFGVFCTENKLR